MTRGRELQKEIKDLNALMFEKIRQGKQPKKLLEKIRQKDQELQEILEKTKNYKIFYNPIKMCYEKFDDFGTLISISGKACTMCDYCSKDERGCKVLS